MKFKGKGVLGGGHGKCKGPELSMSFSEEWTVCVLELGVVVEEVKGENEIKR